MKFKLEADCIIEAPNLGVAATKLRLYFAETAAQFQGIGNGPADDLPIRLIPLPEVTEAKKK